MNIHAKMPSTVDEFLRWNEGREGKREFVRGRVVEMMIHTTRNHARICYQLMAELGAAIDTDLFDIGSADFAVETNDGVRYPDVFVDQRVPAAKGTDLAAKHPVLLAEVLSPSSYARDFGEKVEDYKSLPTLQHYLILAQDEPRAWLWTHTGGTWEGPQMIVGLDEKLELTGLAAGLSMASLYRGIA